MADAADDLEQLKQQKERLELKAQIETFTAPWWRKAGLIATVTAIIAAILPIKTAIEEHYSSEREYTLQQARQVSDLAMQKAKQQNDIALQQAKQEHEIRMAYLDHFEVPGHRLQTLRFLLAISADPRLLAWATAEQKIVQAEVDAIAKQLLAVAERIEKAPPGQGLDELKQMYEKLREQHGRTTLRPQAAGSAGSAGSAAK
ncbi:MAG TPA: hypothetical protein VNO30_15000 [Kofleriaceae bacterium]|nr:hypothetical protein [Kofleriaceae bacterium]